MVNTGQIAFITETGGGKDANGNPVPSTKVESAFAPCNLSVIKKEYKAYIDGQFREAKYSILVHNRDIPIGVNLAEVHEVHIKDFKGVDLGNHQIQNPENLRLFNQIKIVV